MSRVALDTSCLVAAACSWHEHHAATVEAIGAASSHGDDFVVPCHALAEAYAVLTRLPPPHRLSPADAFDVLEGSWRGRSGTALDSEAYWAVLEVAAEQGTSGGALYDAIIVAAAKQAGATVILTWNLEHFQRLASPDIDIVAPHREGLL